VQKLLMSSTARFVVRKKAALCLLRLYKKDKDMLNSDVWGDTIYNLLDERDLGLLLSVMPLLEQLISDGVCEFQGCFRKLVNNVLERLASKQEIPPEYMYYGIPSPWLQVRVMRVLPHFTMPHDPKLHDNLINIIKKVLENTKTSVRNLNKHNAMHAVLFEAINLAFHFDTESRLMKQCVDFFGSFISTNEANIRYLGLENVSRFSLVPEVLERMKTHQNEIINALYDDDISIKRRALDMLYSITDTDNSDVVVDQLLDYLPQAEFALREEIALKASMIAERFYPSMEWYVDTLVRLIDKGAEYVSEDIWYSLVHVVTNNSNLQKYAAEHFTSKLKEEAKNEMFLKVSAYLLGEFGMHLESAPSQYMWVLKDQVPLVGDNTKSIIVAAFAKLAAKSSDASLKQDAETIFSKYKGVLDLELQQRSAEFSLINQRAASNKPMRAALDKMPAYSKRERKQYDVTDAELEAPSAVKAGGDLLTAPEASANGNAGAGPSGAGNAAAIPAASPIEDLLSEPAQQGQKDAQLGSGLGDLLSGGDDGAGATAAPSVPLVHPSVDLRTQQRRLRGSNSAVLYQDNNLQVGVKSEWRETQGRLSFYLGNLSASATVGAIKCEFPSEHNGMRFTYPTNIPTEIQPQQQVICNLDVLCIAPFAEAPQMSLAYVMSDNSSRGEAQLAIPAYITKFMRQESEISSGDFFAQWKQVTDKKQSTWFPLGEKIAQGGAKLVKSVCTYLNLASLEGFDPTVRNAVGAGRLGTSGGELYLVLVRIEVSENEKQVRVTVAGQSSEAAMGVYNSLTEALSL
jgi:AP-2 complex subunit alpha